MPSISSTPVNGDDVWMVQRSEELCFMLKAGEPLGVIGPRAKQNLDRDVALQPRVERTIHFAHAAGSDRLQAFERSESSACSETDR